MFYLVGSRFFGTYRPDSDWDFLAENTPERHEDCLRLGLKRLENSPHVRYYGNGLDVCLVDDLERSLKARDIVASSPEIVNLPKNERHQKLKEIKSGL